MVRRTAASVLALAALVTGIGASCPAVAGEGFTAAPLVFSDLSGWARDDHAQALAAFRAACRDAGPATPDVSREAGRAATLGDICREAPRIEPGAARAFFEARFRPLEIRPREGGGFLTGYYEPVLDASSTRDPAFPAPLLASPADLVARPRGDAPGFPPGLTAARLTSTGLVALPARREIDAGALGDAAPPLVFLHDAVDAFTVHVQGSARLRLQDGRRVRAVFAGRNGHPYTAIGRVLAERLGESPAAMDAERVFAWLRQNPAEAGDVMNRNASFIFFRLVDDPDPAAGPVGAGGWPLTAGRSLAVDAARWPYGLPVWLEGAVPGPDGVAEPLSRLVIAGDTGAAIVGPARGDLFVGSGAEAGRIAGRMRGPVRFVVLWPLGLSDP